MLRYLLAGGLVAGTSGPILAQQGQPGPASRPPTATPQNRQPAGNDAAENANPEDVQELERVLVDWEQKTTIITKLSGVHYRYEYDSVFKVEKRALGDFWYESPDKGRIDFNVKDEPPLGDPKEGYQVKAESPAIWTCDGVNILQINITDRTYDQIQIPPHARGENIMDGPLPFLFGMKAERAKARYKMTLGRMHDPKGLRRNRHGQPERATYHVIAKPRLPDDASNWSQAEALLDAEYCLPTAIRLLDPAGNTETVYRFPLDKIRANRPDRIWDKDPFKPKLNGFRLLHSGIKESDEPERTGGILPVNGTK